MKKIVSLFVAGLIMASVFMAGSAGAAPKNGPPGGTTAGKIVLYVTTVDTNAPIAKAAVSVYDRYGNNVLLCTTSVVCMTDAQGSLRALLPEGDYKMMVSAQAYDQGWAGFSIVADQATVVRVNLTPLDHDPVPMPEPVPFPCKFCQAPRTAR